MNNILKIYKRDIKAVVTNWVMLVVICGLIILPSLYAWFNIKSSWDPYGKTSGIDVAIVNEDEGAIVSDKSINIGNMLQEQLEENTSMGWNFVTKEEAEKGVRVGEFYATILIPNNFTKNLTMVLEGKIVKPTLIYTVNEKSNAIAPKITDKGVSTIKDEIDGEIVKAVDGALFAVINDVGVNYVNDKDKIDRLIEGVFYLEENIDKIQEYIINGGSTVDTISEITKNLQGWLPELEKLTSDGIVIMSEGKTFMNSASKTAEDLNVKLKNDFKAILDELNVVKGKIESIDLSASKESIVQSLNNIKSKLGNVEGQVDSLIKSLSKINSVLNIKEIETAINSLNNIKVKLEGVQGSIDKAIENISNSDLIGLKAKLLEGIDYLIGSVNSLYESYDEKIAPYVKKSIDYGINVFTLGEEFLLNTQEALPSIKRAINNINDGSIKADKGINKLLQEMPTIKDAVKKYANKIRTIQGKGDIEQLKSLLGINPEEGGIFLSSPIQIEQETLFHIPNYGSAMSPFFTTLALWVGALILVSLLSVDTSHEEKYTYLEKYFGKMLIFLNIAILQGLITSLGDLFILKTYVKEPGLFVLSSCFISIIFMIIIYTLVSVFGNVGKALGVVLLVLQISSSGGTFPVEVMPEFFQVINPLLPFTYGIGLMREATAGIVRELLISNVTILCLYGVVFIIIGALLKGVVNKKSGYFKEKLKESGLLGH